MNNREKRWIWILAAFIAFIGVSLSLFMATILDAILAQTFSIPFIKSLSVSMCIQNVLVNPKIRIFFGAFSVIALGSAFFVSTSRFGRLRAELVQITPRIAIPAPAGEGQYGTAWFTDIPAPIPYRKGDSKAYFNTHVINKSDPLFTWLLEEGKQDCEMVKNGEIIDFSKVDVYPGETAPFSEIVTGKKSAGFVVGMEVKRFAGIEYIYSVDHNSHAICFGATRCGKSRCVVQPTICLVALGGDSMFITDLKRELIDYTRPYLLRLGYSVYELNFKRPECSNRYNFLEGIIEAVRQGDLPGAVEKTWDMAAILCEKGGETQDPLWRNGEGAVIAMCIFIVVYNNQDHYEYQNLTNVYYFMAEMCGSCAGKEWPPIDDFLRELRIQYPDHPAMAIYGIPKIAPSKTRGSFYTQALTTLRLFTNPKIAYMTSATDFRFKAMGKDKMALFVVLPGNKDTYFRLATLLVSLCYDELSEVSDHNGGGLDRRVRFILDEFGNFSAFDNLQSMETEGGGKDILLDFFIQDSAQLDMKYSKEMTQIIMSNCETWLYLKSDGQDTRELLSKKLGAYTTVAYGQNMNNQRYSTSSGQSAQLIRRELLTADEIACIERPYSLVFSRNPPVLKNAPDFSKWQFNTMLGMAGEEHNKTLRHLRGLARKEAAIPPLALWGIWRVYKYPDEVMKQLREEVDQFDVLRFREDEAYRKLVLRAIGHVDMMVQERPAISDAEAGVVMNDDDMD